MIRLASIIKRFERVFISTYGSSFLPSQRKALGAMKNCRSSLSPLMKTCCSECDHIGYIPHSCGHRSCPHCQNHESQAWIDRQNQKRLPVNYFMITFTLPKELRSLAFLHQRVIYSLFFQCVWDTLNTFSLNDQKLQGTPGVVAVLHTHSRRLDFHPHIHTIMPAGALDKKHSLWRQKSGKYLFHHKALAKVFRAKMLDAIQQSELSLPLSYPQKWVVDCKKVGSGDKAFVYLGRYLYRGVIQEKDILKCTDDEVTFRYKDSTTKRYKTRTLSGVEFIRLILQHVLPRRFRRAREYGLLHPNSKNLIKKLHVLLKFYFVPWKARLTPRAPIACSCCGGEMKTIQTRIKPIRRLFELSQSTIADGGIL
jgi:hypothetical protein